jgi:hypothetical protein
MMFVEKMFSGGMGYAHPGLQITGFVLLNFCAKRRFLFNFMF